MRQHQLVYAALGDRMREEIHALSMTHAHAGAMGAARSDGHSVWMDKLLIEGGRPLVGEVRVSGAKNAALPILCAALLTAEPLVLTNVPRLNDVRTMQTLLAQMGVAHDAPTPARVALDAAQRSTGRSRPTSS